MAAGDWTGPVASADRPDAGLTAGEKIADVTIDDANNPDAVAADAAATAGVRYAAFIDYAEALAAFDTRADIESLASRRARTYAASDAEQDYMRETPGSVPGPGSVNGEAPSEGTVTP